MDENVKALFTVGVSCAIFCGLWSWIAGVTGLIGWAGFAGCTTYFASGKHGIEGIKKTIIPNLTGVICGMTIIVLSSMAPTLGNTGVWCALITFIMCVISKYEILDFCPGIFMGCFTTFAAEMEKENLQRLQL